MAVDISSYILTTYKYVQITVLSVDCCRVPFRLRFVPSSIHMDIHPVYRNLQSIPMAPDFVDELPTSP